MRFEDRSTWLGSGESSAVAGLAWGAPLQADDMKMQTEHLACAHSPPVARGGTVQHSTVGGEGV